MKKHSTKKTDASLKLHGIEVLATALGPSQAIKFLSLMHQDSTDYVKVSRTLYKDQSVDDIFNRAAYNWRKQKTHSSAAA